MLDSLIILLNKVIFDSWKRPRLLVGLLLFVWIIPSLSLGTEKSIETRFGDFSLDIPVPQIAVLPAETPIKIESQQLSVLPEWREPVESGWSLPSFFVGAEDYYKEGLRLYNTGLLNESLQRFQEVLKEDDEKIWTQAGNYWIAHIHLRLGNELESINEFSKILSSGSQSRYAQQSAYTLIWMDLRNQEYANALTQITRFMKSISDPLFIENVLPLKAHAHFQLQQFEASLDSLLQLKEKFPRHPQFFETVVRIAELHFHLKQWKKIDPLIRSYRDQFYNYPRMERLLLLGVWSDLYQQEWKGVQQKLKWLEELGSQNVNPIAQSYFYLYLWQNDAERAQFQLGKFSSEEAKSRHLRHLFHKSLEQEWFDIILSNRNQENLWAAWNDEAYFLIGYAYEKLGQEKEAYEAYQKALFNIRSVELSEQVEFSIVRLELQTGNFDRATENLKRMLVDYRDSALKSEYAFWSAVARYEWKPNDSFFALLTFNQVETDSDRSDDRFYYGGRIHHSQKSWRKANEVLTRLTENHEDSRYLTRSYFYRADSLYARKQFQKTDKTLREWRQKRPQEPIPVDMAELWANSLIALKQFQEADQVLEEALRNSKNYFLVELRVQVLKQLEKKITLVQFITEYLSPDFTQGQKGFLHLTRANTAFDLDRKQEAVSYYSGALNYSAEKHHRYIHHQLAKLNYELENYPEFIVSGEEVLKDPIRDQMATNMLILMSNYYMNINNKEQEAKYRAQLADSYETKLETAELSKDEKVDLLVKLAKNKNILGKYKEADEVVDKVISLKGPELQFEALREKGYAAYNGKNYEKAVNSYLKVVYLAPNATQEERFDLLMKIAYSYQQIEQLEEAKAVYRKLIKEFDQSEHQEEAKKHLEALNVSRETK